jgi:outer membrane immunogenic protein
VSSTPPGPTATSEEFVDGWTLGGGAEIITWGNLILGLEYDYVNLNLSSASSCDLCVIGIPLGGGPQAIAGDATISSVMVRASWLFNPED